MFRITLSAIFLLALSLSSLQAAQNFVVIFADDLGWGDLGAYGHPTINTPNLDRMAREGQKWTNFYVGASVCTPSRAALLTGRLPIRNGMMSSRRRVFFPDSTSGMQHREVTIAEVLKQKGYATGALGKWHLGHLPQYLPMAQGFDSYYGIPYSNDMDGVPDAPRGMAKFLDPKIEYWNVPLLRNDKQIERPADQTTITKRYTEEAVKFIEKNKDKPFFLYLAHSMVHVPLFRSPAFEGRSRRGLFGDALEEIDWSAGQILEKLEQLKLHKDTLVVFTSDNGPWLTYNEQGGSAGGLRMGKGSTWEGGMRVPGIFRQPGKVKPGVVQGMGSTMDLLPTIAAMAGAKAPTDRILDGHDLTATLTQGAPSPRNEMFYYRGYALWAARVGSWKAHFRTKSGYLRDPEIWHNTPLLYNLDQDPGEKYDVADQHPEALEQIRAAVAKHREGWLPEEDQLYKREIDEPPARDPNQWESAMKAFEEADRKNPPPTGATVFIGSSSIRRWDLAKYFPGVQAVNRGFGGSHMEDSVRYADRILIPLKPKTVVVSAGDNDLAGKKTPQRVRDDFRAFVKTVHDALPETKIIYIGVKPSLARWNLIDSVRMTNDLIRAEAAKDKRLVLLDVDAPMLGEDGTPRKELFVEDGLHLSPAGDQLWADLLKPLL